MDLRRNLSPGFLTALAAPVCHPIYFVHLDWVGAPIRAHSGTGLITWGGYSWSGVGGYGEVEIPEEALGGVPSEFGLTLAVPVSDIVDYTDDPVRGRIGRIYVGATTEAGGNALVGDPSEIASGTIDRLNLTTEREEIEGQTILVHRLRVSLTTGPGYRTSAAIMHSEADQKAKHPLDTAARHLVLALTKAELTEWPEP